VVYPESVGVEFNRKLKHEALKSVDDVAFFRAIVEHEQEAHKERLQLADNFIQVGDNHRETGNPLFHVDNVHVNNDEQVGSERVNRDEQIDCEQVNHDVVRAKRLAVYVVGAGIGATFAMKLAEDCGDLIDAMASVTALVMVGGDARRAWDADGASLWPPLPTMFVANSDDPIFNAADGGPVGPLPRGPSLPVDEFVQRQKERVHGRSLSFDDSVRHLRTCNKLFDDERTVVAERELPTLEDDGTRVVLRSYESDRPGAQPLHAYNVIGGGHTWPGGERYLPEFLIGRVTANLNACESILSFFESTLVAKQCKSLVKSEV
jgi:poly(3-hydroxybutyrate) depolymerase